MVSKWVTVHTTCYTFCSLRSVTRQTVNNLYPTSAAHVALPYLRGTATLYISPSAKEVVSSFEHSRTWLSDLGRRDSKNPPSIVWVLFIVTQICSLIEARTRLQHTSCLTVKHTVLNNTVLAIQLLVTSAQTYISARHTIKHTVLIIQS